MKTIIINGKAIEVSVETAKRIEHVAEERKIPFTEAINFCLEKVI